MTTQYLLLDPTDPATAWRTGDGGWSKHRENAVLYDSVEAVITAMTEVDADCILDLVVVVDVRR